MEIKIVRDKIALSELRKLARIFYKTMIKGVVDIEKGIVAFGGEYHMDANLILIQNGSLQQDVWGFNLYFDRSAETRLEYVSLINIRPQAHNFDMEVQSPVIRDKMMEIINSKLYEY